MNKLNKESSGISALLVHAAKIDEYSEHERNLIKDFIRSYLKKLICRKH